MSPESWVQPLWFVGRRSSPCPSFSLPSLTTSTSCLRPAVFLYLTTEEAVEEEEAEADLNGSVPDSLVVEGDSGPLTTPTACLRPDSCCSDDFPTSSLAIYFLIVSLGRDHTPPCLEYEGRAGRLDPLALPLLPGCSPPQLQHCWPRPMNSRPPSLVTPHQKGAARTFSQTQVPRRQSQGKSYYLP